MAAETLAADVASAEAMAILQGLPKDVALDALVIQLKKGSAGHSAEFQRVAFGLLRAWHAGDSQRGFSLLIDALRDPDPLIRLSAVQTLGNVPTSRKPEAADRLVLLFEDSNSNGLEESIFRSMADLAVERETVKSAAERRLADCGAFTGPRIEAAYYLLRVSAIASVLDGAPECSWACVLSALMRIATATDGTFDLDQKARRPILSFVGQCLSSHESANREAALEGLFWLVRRDLVTIRGRHDYEINPHIRGWLEQIAQNDDKESLRKAAARASG